MFTFHRSCLRCCLSIAALCAAPVHSQGTWPAKPIRLIVPLEAGGLIDGFARTLGQHLTERMGQPIVAENRPGASQMIAGELTARSAPDGYTLQIISGAGMRPPSLAQKMPYDPVRDFSPVSTIFVVPWFLLTHPSVPASTLQELVTYARANPSKLSYASFGQGTGNHIGVEALNRRFGIDMVHVPYKGSAQSMTDLLSGRILVMFNGGQTAFPNIKSGKLRVIAVSSIKRSYSMPDLPTVAEQGIPGFDIVSWFGLVGPAGLPRTIVDRLNMETVALLNTPAVRDKYATFGIDMTPSTPQELGERIRREPSDWAKAMSEAGVKPE